MDYDTALLFYASATFFLVLFVVLPALLYLRFKQKQIQQRMFTRFLNMNMEISLLRADAQAVNRARNRIGNPLALHHTIRCQACNGTGKEPSDDTRRN